MVAFSLIFALVASCSASSLPIVDLSYELHQAISSTQGLYNFSNIRYAAPPVGDLRFRAPTLPAQNRSQVQNGSVARMCPQAKPIWATDIMPEFLLSVLEGVPFNQSTNISSYPYVPPKSNSQVTEDCLFLDVIVPKKIFDRSHGNRSVSRSLAPVLVWIYGGGYAEGDKALEDPSGLINRSMIVGEGVVYVAMNYRLGAFGWLGGDTLIANGTANAGLHDQRFALEWIYKNIHLFGGDPERVTLIGDSAGAGSIMHQITAYGGKGGPSRFQQAILQSPAWVPMPDTKQPEQTLQNFLQLLNVSTLDEARQLPSETLIAANAYQIATQSKWGDFTYTPVVDGTFVPALPGQLLMEGKFDHNLTVMSGHNTDEGLEFTPPASILSSALPKMLKVYYPFITQDVIDYVTQVLYPPIYNGTYGYTSPTERYVFLISESIFECNTEYLNWAYENNTFAYEFSVPPSLHGQDTLYTFYNPGRSGIDGGISGLQVQNVSVAFAMQDYFTSFAQFGAPRSPVGPNFPRYGSQNALLDIGNNTIRPVRDLSDNFRCRYWQTAPYY
ncbi:uncharacterized protein N7484_006835 [Penicillium longicatenatum]|uniref:uncharacterized protein n=1 Tax=Penicillium longicatenatum TaxID=1561947 RepID=UPI0025470EB8|nr:uncharacterized protein N7484_006835 [Penicillium longicatenatum]KAJ5638973.1 hypothetical protein N7484_006835 [Penicillium longicatenatum]